MSQTDTVESPVSIPSAAGGSRTSSAPVTAPAGTSVSHGTAGSALVAAAEKAMADEAAASSAASAPVTKPAGDTTQVAATTDGVVTSPEKKPGDGQVPSGTEPARNAELEARFTTVARNAQSKVLQALGLDGVTYQQLPTVAKEMKVAFAILRDMRRNARDFHARLGAELDAKDGGGGDGASAAALKFPDGALVAEDGKTRTYSQDQILKEIVPALKQQITKELLSNGTLQNVINFVDSETSRREATEAETRRNGTIQSVLTELRKDPQFGPNEQEVTALLSAWHAADPDRVRAMGVHGALHAAWNKVLQTKVYGDGYKSTIEQQIRDEMRKKALGGNQPNVDTTGRTDGKKPELTNVSQLADHMRKLESASA